MTRRKLVRLATALCLLVATGSANAQIPREPVLTFTRQSFTDSNGNGLLDCGEEFYLLASVTAPKSIDVNHVSTGTVSVATTRSQWDLSTPAAAFDPSSRDCEIDVVQQGNLPGDTAAIVDYRCQHVNPDPDRRYVFATVIRGRYLGGQPLIVRADASFETINLSATYTATDVAVCPAPVALVLSKTISSGSPVPGEVLTYSLTVQNTGTTDSAPVTLTERVPEHTRFYAAGSSPGWSCPSPGPGADCSLALGSVAGGAAVSRLFAVQIDSPLPAGVTEIANTACANDGDAVADCDSLAVPAQASTDFAVLKTLESGSAEPGGLLVYNISVTNTGHRDAAGVIVSDQLPRGTLFSELESTPGWLCPCVSEPLPPGTSKGLCTTECTLPPRDLPAGETVSVRIATRVSQIAPGTTHLSNTGCASDDRTRRFCSSVETPVAGPPRLRLEKRYDGPPLTPGADLPFTLVLTNDGGQAASGIRLREVIPPASSFQSAGSDPRWSCPATTPGTSCELVLSVPAGQSVSIAFVLRADNPLPPGVTQISNSACLETAAGEVTCDDVSTPAPALLEATLTDSQPSDPNGNGRLDDGETLHYRLVVRNPSSSTQPATNVTVTTDLDGHLSLVPGSLSISSGSISTGAAFPTVLIPSLAPGARVTIDFDALVLDAVASGLRSVSSQGLVRASGLEPVPTDDPDTAAALDPTVTPVGAQGPGPGGPGGVPAIPTLGELGLALLAVLLAGFALLALRRRSKSA